MRCVYLNAEKYMRAREWNVHVNGINILFEKNNPKLGLEMKVLMGQDPDGRYFGLYKFFRGEILVECRAWGTKKADHPLNHPRNISRIFYAYVYPIMREF